ncbi:hypothetical protein FUA23_01935 [Neolewinella aurantiaca]|uniref:Uncharacterized protein n=1 Tax=Neolewinella aurantiaca TaxID=2602767 RepID=A0A5C7G126_9BACT|nr:hypothetical protein [Neolewinella aurantiaca]TXF91479.1 hypothetical protein FUA23_01935 [Neolewinella aurantiaca]
MRTCIVFLSLSFLLSACGSEASADLSVTGNASIDKALAEAETQLGTTSSGSFCLGQEGTSVCDFLDKGLIAGYLPEGAEEKGYKETDRSMLSSCGYSIEHPTKTISLKVAKSVMKVPATYLISLAGISSYDTAEKARSRFLNTYKTFTPEEAADLRKKMEEGIDAKVAKGEITAEQGEMSKGFGGIVGKARWEPVSGVGDLAVWGNSLPDKEPETKGSLAVLRGDTYFTIDVDLLESRAHSKEAALEIARAVLAKCD